MIMKTLVQTLPRDAGSQSLAEFTGRRVYKSNQTYNALNISYNIIMKKRWCKFYNKSKIKYHLHPGWRGSSSQLVGFRVSEGCEMVVKSLTVKCIWLVVAKKIHKCTSCHIGLILVFVHFDTLRLTWLSMSLFFFFLLSLCVWTLNSSCSGHSCCLWFYCKNMNVMRPVLQKGSQPGYYTTCDTASFRGAEIWPEPVIPP